MKCHGCNTQMILDKRESDQGAQTQWHSCPLCGKVRLTSQPASFGVDLRVQHSRPTVQKVAEKKPTQRKRTPFYA